MLLKSFYELALRPLNLPLKRVTDLYDNLWLLTMRKWSTAKIWMVFFFNANVTAAKRFFLPALFHSEWIEEVFSKFIFLDYLIQFKVIFWVQQQLVNSNTIVICPFWRDDKIRKICLSAFVACGINIIVKRLGKYISKFFDSSFISTCFIKIVANWKDLLRE